MNTFPLVVYSWMGNLGLGIIVYLLAVLIASGMLRRVASEETGSAPRGRWGWLNVPLALYSARLLHHGKEPDGNPVTWKESNLRDDPLKAVLYRVADVLLLVWVASLYVQYLSAASETGQPL